MHLDLDDPSIAADLLRRRNRRVGGVDRVPARYRQSLLGEERLRLVLVYVHLFS
jgi:hypothetical protein